MRLHGITADVGADQPSFCDRLTRPVALATGMQLVAHNASSDHRRAARGLCRRRADVADHRLRLLADHGLTGLHLISYRPPMAAAECGIELARHHEAGADARACAEVVLELARRRRLRRKQMSLTACPLSNETLRCVDSLSEHPLRRMLDAGLADT